MGKLAEAARSLIGTRYRHRGRSEHGVDCAGLVAVAYQRCGVSTHDFLHYGREPNRDGALVKHVTIALGDPLPAGTQPQDDDVLVMRFDKEPHHMALCVAVDYGGTPAINIIHADGHAGRVLEQRLDYGMRARITHIFRRAV